MDFDQRAVVDMASAREAGLGKVGMIRFNAKAFVPCIAMGRERKARKDLVRKSFKDKPRTHIVGSTPGDLSIANVEWLHSRLRRES
jgi:hypothetical protein